MARFLLEQLNNDIYVMYVYCQVHCAVWLGLLKFCEYIKLEVAKINDKKRQG